MNEYGLDVNVVNKGSQVSVDELHSMANATRAVVSQRLECRARDLDIVRSWGFDIDVTPNYGRTQPTQPETKSEVLDDDV